MMIKKWTCSVLCLKTRTCRERTSRTRGVVAKSALSLLSDIIRDRKSSGGGRSKPIVIDFDDSVRFMQRDGSSKRKMMMRTILMMVTLELQRSIS